MNCLQVFRGLLGHCVRAEEGQTWWDFIYSCQTQMDFFVHGCSILVCCICTNSLPTQNISVFEGLDAPFLPLKQSDMCLVCIAFASWVLKTANPQVGDAWKAGTCAASGCLIPQKISFSWNYKMVLIKWLRFKSCHTETWILATGLLTFSLAFSTQFCWPM